MSEKITKALDGVTTVLIVVVVVFAAALIIGKPFGFHAYAVLSGSMEPAYHTGSLIYVKETDTSELGPGDVITYMISKDATATHRIVSVVEGEDGEIRYETKGDANEYSDASLVHPDNVIGTPVLQIPMLGYVVGYIQVPPGTYIAIAACAMVVFLMFLPDLFPARKHEEDEGREAEDPRRNAQGTRSQAARGGQAVPAHAYASSHATGRPAPMRPAAYTAAKPSRALPQSATHAPRSLPAPRTSQASQATRIPQAARAPRVNPAEAQGRPAAPAASATRQPRPRTAQKANASRTVGQAPSATRGSGPNNPRLAKAGTPQAQAERKPQASQAAEGAVKRRMPS